MTVLAHAHGGDLDAIQRTYGIPKEEIIDFSGNINPLGFPKRAEDALKENLHLICTYPDKKYKALKQAIGTYTGADPSHIVVGNGSTELISTFIQTVHAKHSIIMGPAYSEYEREVSLGGGKFEYFPLKEEEDFKLNLPALLKALTPDVGSLSSVTVEENTEVSVTWPITEPYPMTGMSTDTPELVPLSMTTVESQSPLEPPMTRAPIPPMS